jgi:hypothetical protein
MRDETKIILFYNLLKAQSRFAEVVSFLADVNNYGNEKKQNKRKEKCSEKVAKYVPVYFFHAAFKVSCKR